MDEWRWYRVHAHDRSDRFDDVYFDTQAYTAADAVTQWNVYRETSKMLAEAPDRWESRYTEARRVEPIRAEHARSIDCASKSVVWQSA